LLNLSFIVKTHTLNSRSYEKPKRIVSICKEKWSMNRNNLVILIFVLIIGTLTVLNLRSLMKTPNEVSENLNFHALYDLLHDPQVDPFGLTPQQRETLLSDYDQQVMMPERYINYYPQFALLKEKDQKFQFFKKLTQDEKLKIIKNYQGFSKLKPHKRDPLRKRFKTFMQLDETSKSELIKFWGKWKRLAHPVRKKKLNALGVFSE
jgi:hypothetical protein